MAKQNVIDANVTLGLFLRLPYSKNVDDWMRERQIEEASLVVPTLWEYECLTGFRRAVALGLISSADAEQLMGDLLGLEFKRVAPTLELHHAALYWAERLGQSKANDAHYLALAESLSAEFWTADQRLVRGLQGSEVNWVHAV